MPEARSGDASELSPFAIADWLWSFRWLAVTLLACAAVWTAVLFWTEGNGGLVGAPGYNVVIDVYSGGTPVRSASEIVDIYRARMVKAGRFVTSAAGANPIVLQAHSKTLADAAVAESSQLAEQLVAEVKAQTGALATFTQREVVPDFVAKQYIVNTSFVSGVEAGLIQVSRAGVEQVTSTRSAGAGLRLLLPWITCGVLFLVLAGVTSFVSKWRNHR